MDTDNSGTDNVGPDVGERYLWLKSQGRELSTKLRDLHAEFRTIADRLRGSGRGGSDDQELA